jgi:hypothetical protein
MLKFIKKHVYKLLYEYHYHMSNYCWKQVESYESERNYYWEDRVVKHTRKEFELVDKLIALEGI